MAYSNLHVEESGQHATLDINGHVYEGEFKYHKVYGRGVLTCADGRGTFAFLSGDVYRGELRDGQPEGHGIMTYANGSVYDGEWRDGQPEDHGIMTYADWIGYNKLDRFFKVI